MSISPTVRYFLDRASIRFTLIPHPRSYGSMETAEAAHVPGASLAKAVVLENGGSALLVVLPSTHQVDLEELAQHLGQRLTLATEEQASRVFPDCERGSIPPLGQAYGVTVWVDDQLLAQDEIHFEGGDHAELVRVSGEDFRRLMADARHGTFGRHV